MVGVNSTSISNFRYEQRRNGLLIGLLKYLHIGPKVFKEKSDDKLFQMPARKDIVKKAKQLMIKLYHNAAEKEFEAEESNAEISDTENEFESKMNLAMKNVMATPVSPDDKQFKSLDAELTAFETNGKRSENLENLYRALLSIKPTSVSSERAFSISGTFVTKRRARLRNSIVDDLCFSKDFLEKK